MARQRISIACCVNEAYALPLAVMLTSLTERLRPGFDATIYLMHQHVSQKTLDAVNAIVDTRVVQLAGACLERLPRNRTFPPEASAPLVLSDILPEDLEKVLFLDADLLILDDISPLWMQALKGCSLAAVVDPAIPYCHSPRGVKDWQPLCGSLRRRPISRDEWYPKAGSGVARPSARMVRPRVAGGVLPRREIPVGSSVSVTRSPKPTTYFFGM